MKKNAWRTLALILLTLLNSYILCCLGALRVLTLPAFWTGLTLETLAAAFLCAGGLMAVPIARRGLRRKKKGLGHATGFEQLCLFLCLTALFLGTELFVFQLNHYATLGMDEPISLEDFDPAYENMEYDDALEVYLPLEDASIQWLSLNEPVVSVFIEPYFPEDVNSQRFYLRYGDEDSYDRQTDVFTVVNGQPETGHIMLRSCGEVTDLSLVYAAWESDTGIREIVINRTSPLTIFWPRVLVYALLVWGLCLVRERGWFSAPFNPASRAQSLVTALGMVLMAAYLFFLMLFSSPFDSTIPFWENFAEEPIDQYNVEMVDALMLGKAQLDVELNDAFNALLNPYDAPARNAYGAGETQLWDHVYYEGEMYSYFGIVQVLILSLPYRLLTGEYLPTRMAVFVFTSLASVFFMLLWRRIAVLYLKRVPFGLYALGLAALPICALLPVLAVRPLFYEVAIASSLLFVALGLWLLLKAVKMEKTSLRRIALGCLCMALAVGCRPNSVLISLLVPVILWDRARSLWQTRSLAQGLGLLACAALPYCVVGGALMGYNYHRFGSVVEFGTSYMLTVSNLGTAHLLNFTGQLQKLLLGLEGYLLQPPEMRWEFPYLLPVRMTTGSAYLGYFYREVVVGAVSFPVIWALLGLGSAKRALPKEESTLAALLWAMPLVGLLQMAAVSLSGGMLLRYEADFLWLFVLPGLLCCVLLSKRHGLRLMAGLVTASILVGLMIGFSGEGTYFALRNPAVFVEAGKFFPLMPW